VVANSTESSASATVSFRYTSVQANTSVLNSGKYTTAVFSCPDHDPQGSGLHETLASTMPLWAELAARPLLFNFCIQGQIRPAKAIGLDVPRIFLARADEVIE
jgi:hypothetical protein